MILQIGIKDTVGKWTYRTVDARSVEVDDIVKQYVTTPAVRQLTFKKLPAMEVDLFGGRDETSGSVQE